MRVHGRRMAAGAAAAAPGMRWLPYEGVRLPSHVDDRGVARAGRLERDLLVGEADPGGAADAAGAVAQRHFGQDAVPAGMKVGEVAVGQAEFEAELAG